MDKLSSLLLMRFFPARADIGLLILRVWIATTLFLRHGWEKRPGQWLEMVAHFPSLFGLGSYGSFLFAFAGDFIAPFLLVIGLATRWAALYCFGTILVAWSLVHHFVFFGKGPESDHGELIVLYLGALLAIFFAGPGRASVDVFLASGPRTNEE